MACASVGLRSRGHFECCVRSESCWAGVRGRSLDRSHAMNSGRMSERKCSGRWRLREAVLSDSACTPEASKVSRRGPPPSV
eukprot:6019112-Pleurochrysis_carterae.AAC.1